jgi:small-conductance mechanosensitive channel
MTTMRTFLALLILSLLTLPAAAQSKRVYKWLDEHGNVHYSDRLPSEATARQREVLNRDGVRISQLDMAAASPEAAAQRQEMLRSAQRDVALSVSYANEDELRRSHEERLGLVRSGLVIARNNIERIQLTLSDNESHAEALSAAGRPIPVRVQENIEQSRRMLAEQQAEIDKLQDRHDQLLLEQNAELVRYRELAGTTTTR